MVVIDTSIIIDAARRKKAAIDLIASYSGKEPIAITVITKYELLRGATEKDTAFIANLIENFIVYNFEDSAVNEVVKAYKKLEAKGKMINELDLIIAGIAAANNETLVTKDRDFLNFESDQIILVK